MTLALRSTRLLVAGSFVAFHPFVLVQPRPHLLVGTSLKLLFVYHYFYDHHDHHFVEANPDSEPLASARLGLRQER